MSAIDEAAKALREELDGWHDMDALNRLDALMAAVGAERAEQRAIVRECCDAIGVDHARDESPAQGVDRVREQARAETLAACVEVLREREAHSKSKADANGNRFERDRHYEAAAGFGRAASRLGHADLPGADALARREAAAKEAGVAAVYAVLGWQGGTVHDVAREMKRREAASEQRGAVRALREAAATLRKLQNTVTTGHGLSWSADYLRDFANAWRESKPDAAPRTPLPVEGEPNGECYVHAFSSGVCSRGTKSCIVDHAAIAAEDRSEPPPGYGVHAWYPESDHLDRSFWMWHAEGCCNEDDEREVVERHEAIAEAWRHYDAHPAVAALAREREECREQVRRSVEAHRLLARAVDLLRNAHESDPEDVHALLADIEAAIA